MRSYPWLGWWLVCGVATTACAADGGGPALEVNVAALNLEGVGDVVWDLEVVNGATPPDVVWQHRVASTRYGDGAGSASYVGPCDADPAAAQNTVKVWVVGVYAAPVTTVGSFASGAAGGVVGTSVDFQNPTTAGPLTQQVHCAENADVAVQFDVALMRPASQGFFDVAVNFDDIFCSAKFDCCTENAAGDACDADIDLLFAPGGGRSTTMVLGFACTAGPHADVDTVLYLDDLALDCSSPSDATFVADFVVDPSGPQGNQCSAGAVGGGACAAVASPGALDADDYLFQVAVYRGEEQLQSGGGPAQKRYWNVALGVKRKAGAGPGIEDCWLRTRGTADDASGSALVDGGTIAAGAVYPVVRWDVALASCQAEPLTFDDPTAMVRTEYTTTTGVATTFAHTSAPVAPAEAARLACPTLPVHPANSTQDVLDIPVGAWACFNSADGWVYALMLAAPLPRTTGTTGLIGGTSRSYIAEAWTRSPGGVWRQTTATDDPEVRAGSVANQMYTDGTWYGDGAYWLFSDANCTTYLTGLAYSFQIWSGRNCSDGTTTLFWAGGEKHYIAELRY